MNRIHQLKYPLYPAPRVRGYKIPIVIPFGDVVDVNVGTWHAGRWAGGAPVVKIVWKKADNHLSSGFVFSRDARETEALVQEIRSHMQQAIGPAEHV